MNEIYEHFYEFTKFSDLFFCQSPSDSFSKRKKDSSLPGFSFFPMYKTFLASTSAIIIVF